jgi:hypothetical protein
MQIHGIEVTGKGIANCIQKYYPGLIKIAEDTPLFDYVFLFGIRVATCDTALPDDIIGCIRFRPNLILGNNSWELLISEATTDPSPKYLNPKFDEKGRPVKWWYDAEAKMKGGTAWVREGQYLYFLRGDYQGYPSFGPAKPVPVYRWNPSRVGEKFDISKAILSTSNDTLIHRNWSFEYGRKRFFEDSAGCQVVKDNKTLNEMQKWAKRHIQLYKKNSFTYTLLTKEQFINGSR